MDELEWELNQARLVATRATPVQLVANAKYQAAEIAAYWDDLEFDDRMSHYSKRSPEEIWEAPTAAEWDHVKIAVDEYITHGDFEPADDGKYAWGLESIQL